MCRSWPALSADKNAGRFMMNGAEYFIAGAPGGFFGALVFYLMGKKAGKNEEKGDKLEGCIRKNKIAVDVEHTDIDKLQYRD